MAATDKRLLARKADDSGWESWAYGPQLSLTLADHAGAAVMELHDDSARLGIWRFTLACNPPALRLLAQFEAQQAIRLSGQPPQHDGDRACIICHNPIPEDAEECPVCHREQAAPSSTWALLRLGAAKPYRLALLSGFLLTLLGTAAAMVPPYLTMPLMDDVLIPFQNGAPIDYDKVRLYRAACWPRLSGVGPGLGPHLHPGLGQRADRRGPAHHHLRTPAEAVAGILRRQAHRRPDLAHRQRDRPHLRVPVAAPARLRQ